MPTTTARSQRTRASGTLPGAPRGRRSDRAGVPTVCVVGVVASAAVAAVYGLVVDDAYRDVPELLRQTWRAQDAVTLATLPVLLGAWRRARSGSFPAHVLAAGILAWLAYVYAHLAIGAPVNRMFLVYVAILALAGFGLLDALVRVDVAAVGPAFTRAPRRVAAWFLVVAGLGIAALWLSDIVVALAGGVPANLGLGGLANPTWVLDLAWLIPWSLAAAAMLARRHPAGPMIAGPLLVMLTILSAAMLLTTPFALAAGLGGDPVVGPQLVVFTVLFAVLGAVELALLLRARPRTAALPRQWWRPGWWPLEAAAAEQGHAGREPAARSR